MTVPELDLRALQPLPIAGDRDAGDRDAGDRDKDVLLRNVTFLWSRRVILAKVVLGALLFSGIVAFLLPKQYRSTAHLMPPQQTTSGAAMLAALAGKAGANSGLAGLAGGILGSRGNGALFISLLRSGTVSAHIIDMFQLQSVYRKRYVDDTARRLAKQTTIAEDAKSGVITLTVEDSDRTRARDIASAYIEELNALVVRVNTSSARVEREFIERRLVAVQHELQQAQDDMSRFSTENTAIDIKEQTRVTVDAGARLQGQLVAGESELDSLGQIYGPDNVRVRAAQARIALLRRELIRASGGAGSDATHPYPALRQLPALAVPWANLYRKVRIQETVFEMLSAQYETSRIEEAKSIPTVSVIDAPGIPERKYSPHRLLIMLVSAVTALLCAVFFLLMQRSWHEVPDLDPRKLFLRRAGQDFQQHFARKREVR